jgi:hypothetical protein
VRSVIRENRRLTVREVSEEVGTCKSSCEGGVLRHQPLYA